LGCFTVPRKRGHSNAGTEARLYECCARQLSPFGLACEIVALRCWKSRAARRKIIAMKPLALLLLAATALPARACVNDRDSDSLATQARQLPETLRVITGRFERNPPLFYQMRIRRSLDELKTAPRQFGLYDDIGAA